MKKNKKKDPELTPEEALSLQIRKVNIKHMILRFAKKIIADRVAVYSAQAAFYVIMSFAPVLFLMLTFLKYTPLTEDMVLEALEFLINQDTMVYVRRVVNMIYHGSFRFFSFAAISLFWVAGTGIMGLTNGLNSIYSVKENRSYLFRRLRSSMYAVLLVFAMIMTLGVLVFGFRSQTLITNIFPFLETGSYISAVLMVLAVLVFLTFIFNAMYFALPNRKCRFSTQIYGSVFTTISWSVFSVGFSIYLTVAKNLSVLYGGLLTVIMTLLWVYFCMYLFFFGGELNAWMENSDAFPF